MSRSFSSAGAVLVLSLGCVPASGRDLVHSVRSTPLNPPSDPVERDTMPLVVDWPAGLEGRIAAGIQAGVPFGRGTLRAPQHARLLGPDGKEMPCQVNVLSTWDHGQSIKWLEVKFLATREHSDGYRIEFGTAVRPKSFPPLETHESPDEIRVDTGSIVVQVGRTTGDLVTAVRAGGSTRDFLGEPIRGFVVDQDDRTYWTSSHGRDVVVEQTGPVCAVIQVSGWYASDNEEPLNRYVARLFLWTGLETVHLQHTFINTGDCDHCQYRAIGLQTRAALAKVHGVALGGPDAKPLAVELAPHERIALVQQDSSRWASLLGGQREEIDGHLGNSLRIEGEGPTLTAGLRWLWQQHPSGFEVDRTGQIRIHFWSPHAGKLLDLRPAEYLKNLSPTAYETFRLQTKDFSRMHELLPEDGGTRHPTGIGLGKTHDVFFHFSGDSRDLAPEDPLARSRAVLADHPPYAFADPARACQTLVQGRVHPKDTKRFEDVEAMLDAYVQGLYTMRTWDRGFGDGHGFFDFGDTPHQRAHYFHRFWSHMFYVGPASYWKLWFRAGDRLIYEFALANTRHCSDLDTGHHTPAPDGHGQNRAGGTTSDDSGLFHYFASYSGDGYTPEIIQTHNYAEYLCLAHEMTGDPRVRDVIHEVVEAVKWEWRRLGGKPGWAHRATGNGLSQVMSLYELTWDPELRPIVDELARQVVDNTFNGITTGYDRSPADFTLAYIFPGAIKYHRVTGDPRMAEWIVRNADHCRRFSGVGKGDYFAKWDGLAYAYDLTGDRRFAEALRFAVRDWVQGHDPTGWIGKSWGLSQVSLALKAIAELDETPPRPTQILSTTDLVLLDEDDAPIDLDLVVLGPTRAPPLDEARLPQIVLQDPRARIIDTRPYPGAKEDSLFARGGWTESFSLEPDGETGIYVLRLLDMPGPRDESEPMRHDESMISAWMQVTSWTRHRMMARVRPDGVSPGGRYAFGQYDLYVPPATERIRRIRVQANTRTSGETVLRLVAPDSSVAAETPIPPQPPYGMAWFSVEAAPRSDQCGQVWTVDLPDLGEMRRVEIEGVPPYLAPPGQGFAIRSVPMP